MRRHFIAGITGCMLMLGQLSLAAQNDDKAEGAQVYKSGCARCHGADGVGNTPMGKKLSLKDLGSPDVQKLPDSELKHIIDDGHGKMPAFKTKLKPAQVEDVVAHIRTLAK